MGGWALLARERLTSRSHGLALSLRLATVRGPVGRPGKPTCAHIPLSYPNLES